MLGAYSRGVACATLGLVRCSLSSLLLAVIAVGVVGCDRGGSAPGGGDGAPTPTAGKVAEKNAEAKAPAVDDSKASADPGKADRNTDETPEAKGDADTKADGDDVSADGTPETPPKPGFVLPAPGPRAANLGIVVLHEGIVHATVTPAKLDERLAKPVGEGWRTADKEAFDKLYEWEPSRWFTGPKRKRADPDMGSGVDTVVYVDCDPDARRLELVGYNIGGGSRVHITVRGAAVEHLATLAAQRMLSVAWNEFSP